MARRSRASDRRARGPGSGRSPARPSCVDARAEVVEHCPVASSRVPSGCLRGRRLDRPVLRSTLLRSGHQDPLLPDNAGSPLRQQDLPDPLLPDNPFIGDHRELPIRNRRCRSRCKSASGRLQLLPPHAAATGIPGAT